MGRYEIELGAPSLDGLPFDDWPVPFLVTLESGRHGPHAMVIAAVHGNEVCGVHALAAFFEAGIRPARGRMTLAIGNVGAYRQFEPADPVASRYLDEDFNRVWRPALLDGRRSSRELERARALRPIVERADYLLDLHSMLRPGPPLVLCGLLDKGRALAEAVGFPAHIVADGGHADGTRLRDHGAFADPASPHTALLVECGQHWARSSAEVAIEVMLRFLATVGVIDPAHLTARYDGAVLPGQQVFEVSDAITVRTNKFAFTAEFNSFDCIEKAGTMIADDGGDPVKTPYDDCFLVMPSGSLVKGQTAVRFGRRVA